MHCRSLSLLHPTTEEKKGLATEYAITCPGSGGINMVQTSRAHRVNSRGPPVYNINSRVVLGPLDAGIGHTHLSSLLAALDIPVMTHRTFKSARLQSLVASPHIQMVMWVLPSLWAGRSVARLKTTGAGITMQDSTWKVVAYATRNKSLLYGLNEEW